MTDDIDRLLGIAEIAGVFVGFAALVTVVSRRSESVRDLEAFGLVGIVLISVQVVVAALLPVVLTRYGLAPTLVWRASSAFLWVVNLFQFVFVNRSTLGLREALGRRRALGLAVLSLSPFFHVPLLLCIAGAFPELAPAFFFTALVVCIFQVAILFADLVVAMVAGRPSTEPRSSDRG